MGMILYDLAGAEPARRFSPYCWRSKLALAHKNLDFETVAWRFTDKDLIASSGQGKVPVLQDTDHVISDSWDIACYLETAYPDRPSLFGADAGKALTNFVNSWADKAMAPAMAPLLLVDILDHLDEKDKPYFRQTREKAFGAPLEEVVASRDARVNDLKRVLEPLRSLLRKQDFIAGPSPLYADYAVFGNFLWAKCISSFKLLDKDDIIGQWRERMLDACGGLAKQSPGYDF